MSMPTCLYPDIAHVIADLQARGYEYDFCLNDNRLLCSQRKYLLNYFEFEIAEMHYFPPGKKVLYERIVYGIKVPGHSIKGILLLSGKHIASIFPEFLNKKLQEAVCKNKRVVDNGIF